MHPTEEPVSWERIDLLLELHNELQDQIIKLAAPLLTEAVREGGRDKLRALDRKFYAVPFLHDQLRLIRATLVRLSPDISANVFKQRVEAYTTRLL